MNKKILLVLMTVGNALPSVFIKILSRDFDAFTQSFYRFLAAGVFFLAIAFLFFREELKKTARSARALLLIILLALLNLGSVTLWVSGIYFVPATLAEILSKLQVVILIVLSYLLFRDEKEVIRSRSFAVAALLCFAGTAGVVFANGLPAVAYSKGILFVLLASALSSAFALLTKKALDEIHPVVLSAFNVLMVAAGFFVLSLFRGDIGIVARVPASLTAFMLLSGIIGVGSGVGLYLISIRNFGVVVTNVTLLLTPVFTAVFAFFSMGEKLSLWQMVSGAVLVLGCYILIKSQRVRDSEIQG